MTLKAVDCCTTITPTIAKALKQSGIDVVLRYLTGRFAMTKDEISTITSAGLAIGSIYETNPTSVAYFTFAQGLADGKAAFLAARALGQPNWSGILFTVDYDAQESDIPAIRNYVNGVKQSIAGMFNIGLYGNYTVVSAFNSEVDYTIQTYAWSGGKIAPGIAGYQHQNSVGLCGISVDLDDIYTDFGLWPEGVIPMSEPTLQLGSTGAAVKTLQTDLNNHGAIPKLTVDGDFGPATETAVKAFQKANGLTQDGIVGPITWSALEKPVAPPTPTPTPTPAPMTHNYTLDVYENDTAVAGEWVAISVETKDNGKPLGNQTVTLTVNGQNPQTLITDPTSGGYGWGIMETTNTTDTVEVKWTDPAGVLHTVTKTTAFAVPQTTDAPAPADVNVVVRIPILPDSDASDAIFFNITAPNGQDIKVQLDTGAFELMFTTDSAKTLGLANEGSLSVQGVGGTASAYYSSANFSINGVSFTSVPCVVEDAFQGLPLFGYKFFVDNGFDLLISQKHNQIVIMKAQ